jgi:ABC-2 type transport system ATP-binding protein
MTVPAIELDGLSREFARGAGRTLALDDVSFRVEPGEVVALLGPNGAGKTTVAKILSTLLLPTSGTARVLGHDVVGEYRAVRERVSVVFGGDRGLYPRLSGRDNLTYFAMLAGVPARRARHRGAELLDGFGLADAASRRVETYSKGMKQRLHLAIGLVSEPSVLLLDEPTAGLDPLEADRLRDSVTELKRTGVSILLTSHYLLDVERLADRVVMLQDGAVTANLPLAAFAAEAGYSGVVTALARPGGVEPAPLPGAAVRLDSRRDLGRHMEWAFTVSRWDAEVFAQLGAVLDRLDVVEIHVRPARLEEAFSSLLRAGR